MDIGNVAFCWFFAMFICLLFFFVGFPGTGNNSQTDWQQFVWKQNSSENTNAIFCILVNSVFGFCKAEGNGHVTVGKRTPRSLSRNYQTPPSLSPSLVYLSFLAGYIGRIYTDTTFSLSRVYLSFFGTIYWQEMYRHPSDHHRNPNINNKDQIVGD